ncbi:peptide ABC transporter substrate-binding protein [Bifidobacterium biavatii]|uniref:Dipeptide/oligopeptide ABC transporter substrate-binding protein n=1 Tax=Bifidobacterium biavatii DSM 23969 TaxID=1437608 RepID=A0A086ZNA5_9BIFI|nr:ABC transporter substrate-binding protein [Bifidobacterium biavatii]KFI48005.1 dipeptide/oligopeptide ABC transporter substrate-binding protein [Bifidobacterium biavatii DSM 23969]
MSLNISRIRRIIATISAATLLAGALAGCGSATAQTTAGTEIAYDPVSISGTAPGGDLIPTNAGASGRKTLVWLLFDTLVDVDPETNQVVNEVADSIESDDQRTWTITIKDGLTFSDGSPLKADNFIKAWTWGADIANAQVSSGDLAVIKGYDKLHPADGSKATTNEFEGLKKVDDLTFTVELASAYSGFRNLLTSTAFLPLPDAFFKDPDAWRKNPIGNGPYKLRKPVDEATGAYFDLNKRYKGNRTPHNTGVYVKFYTDTSSAYQDVLADNLDITSPGGADLLTAKDDFGDRLVEPTLTGPNTTLTFPLWDSYWNSEQGLKVRQAISLAIDREEIVNKVFNGYAVAARDFTVKGLNGWNDSIPGSDILDYNPTKAKQLLEEAGGYDKELPIYYNSDGGHKQWVEAVANQLKKNLGLNVVPSPTTTFADFLQKRADHKFTGPWRAAEIPFNPGLDDMLRNVYSTADASESSFGWHSDAFESKLKEGWAQKDTDEANKKFNEAQEILFKELPAIPLWYAATPTVYSTKVSNVVDASFGSAVYLVEKK